MTNTITKTALKFGFFAALVLTLQPSIAGAVEASAEQRRLCTPDAFRLCASEIPNVDAITACMRKKKASLSTGCAAVFDKPAATIKSASVD